MGKEERETEPRFGTVNFERRRHPRFVVDLPIEYWKVNHLKSCPSRAANVCEGGLLVHLSEQLEIGQNLRLNLFVDAGADLNCIEALVQVVWKDLHLGKEGDYRTGVKFVDISENDLDALRRFLKNLMNLKSPSELKIPSRLASTLTNFSGPNRHKQK
jgi:c-di-GMP-binding flagellar brake protein YcgR